MLVTPGTKAWPCGHLHPVPQGGGAGGAGGLDIDGANAHHAGAVCELLAGLSVLLLAYRRRTSRPKGAIYYGSFRKFSNCRRVGLDETTRLAMV